MDGVPRYRRGIPLALIVAIAALLAAASAQAAAVAGQSPAAVREYWTLERMLAAEPAPSPAPAPTTAARAAAPDRVAPSYVSADGAAARLRAGRPGATGDDDGLIVRNEVVDPAAPEVRMHGKIFFTIGSGTASVDYVCSGTVVNSRRRSLVWTAGHCLSKIGQVARNWLFVPAFSEQGMPFGEWPAKRLLTTPGWKRSNNYSYDVGAAIVAKSPNGRRLQNVVGARGIGFNQPRDQNYSAFGYPAIGDPAEFSGAREYVCLSPNAGADMPPGRGPSTMTINCDMTPGASGGGWIAGETLLSVTSYLYDDSPGLLYGPYLGSVAKALYKKANRKRKRRCGCAGKRDRPARDEAGG